MLTLHDFGGAFGTAFENFLLGSHNFMVMALDSCGKWSLKCILLGDHIAFLQYNYDGLSIQKMRVVVEGLSNIKIITKILIITMNFLTCFLGFLTYLVCSTMSTHRVFDNTH